MSRNAITMCPDRCLFVDVDLTLIRPLDHDELIEWGVDITLGGSMYRPLGKNIRMLKRFAGSNGVNVVVWSAGGAKWAEQVIRELGLGPYVDLIISKPSWFLDDRADAGFFNDPKMFIDATK